MKSPNSTSSFFASAAAGWLLELALNREGASSSDIAFGERGKPFLPDRDDLFFSLSHTDGTVCCLVSSEPCGCDVQSVRRASPLIVARHFAAAERDLLDRTPDADRDRAFTGMWTLKEAAMKACGLGFALPMRKVDTAAGTSVALKDGSYELFAMPDINGCRLGCCVRDAAAGDVPAIIQIDPLAELGCAMTQDEKER